MRKYLYPIFSVALLALTSCSKKEEYAYPAQYGKIHAIPSVIYPGDTVIIEAELVYSGHRIYKGEYTWSNDDGFKEVVKVLAEDGDKTIYKAPQVKWVPKKSGSFKFSMSALLRYSMPDENGQMVGAANAYTTTIKVSRRE